jgi:hypothetical protein
MPPVPPTNKLANYAAIDNKSAIVLTHALANSRRKQADGECRLMALSVISLRRKICPLLSKSGQWWILARDGLSANDPKRTLGA